MNRQELEALGLDALARAKLFQIHLQPEYQDLLKGLIKQNNDSILSISPSLEPNEIQRRLLVAKIRIALLEELKTMENENYVRE